jgi:ribosomal protein S27AE
MREVTQFEHNFRVSGRATEDEARHRYLDPFEDPSHQCPACGRSHFVYNLTGRFFCQRCSHPMGQLVMSNWGIPHRQWD